MMPLARIRVTIEAWPRRRMHSSGCQGLRGDWTGRLDSVRAWLQGDGYKLHVLIDVCNFCNHPMRPLHSATFVAFVTFVAYVFAVRERT
jgi:hypothetical protein